jgi:hypothetical protein
VVLCTASAAGRKSLRTFQPEIVLVEEASQITEQTCLISIMRNYSNFIKVILSGDKRQLPPTVLSAGQNGYYNAAPKILTTPIQGLHIPPPGCSHTSGGCEKQPPIGDTLATHTIRDLYPLSCLRCFLGTIQCVKFKGDCNRDRLLSKIRLSVPNRIQPTISGFVEPPLGH